MNISAGSLVAHVLGHGVLGHALPSARCGQPGIICSRCLPLTKGRGTETLNSQHLPPSLAWKGEAVKGLEADDCVATGSAAANTLSEVADSVRKVKDMAAESMALIHLQSWSRWC